MSFIEKKEYMALPMRAEVDVYGEKETPIIITTASVRDENGDLQEVQIWSWLSGEKPHVRSKVIETLIMNGWNGKAEDGKIGYRAGSEFPIAFENKTNKKGETRQVWDFCNTAFRKRVVPPGTAKLVEALARDAGVKAEEDGPIEDTPSPF